MNMNVMWVSHSFACDTETRELGEAYQDLKAIERAYRLLERRLERAEPNVHGLARRLVYDLRQAIGEVRNDTCLGMHVDLARDAFGEAMVRKVVRP